MLAICGCGVTFHLFWQSNLKSVEFLKFENHFYRHLQSKFFCTPFWKNILVKPVWVFFSWKVQNTIKYANPSSAVQILYVGIKALFNSIAQLRLWNWCQWQFITTRRQTVKTTAPCLTVDAYRSMYIQVRRWSNFSYQSCFSNISETPSKQKGITISEHALKKLKINNFLWSIRTLTGFVEEQLEQTHLTKEQRGSTLCMA